MITKRDYQDALDSQSAVNLSGIVITLANIMNRIWSEAQIKGKGTKWVNKHPICRLFTEQIAFLTNAGTPTGNGKSWDEAFDFCMKKISEQPIVSDYFKDYV